MKELPEENEHPKRGRKLTDNGQKIEGVFDGGGHRSSTFDRAKRRRMRLTPEEARAIWERIERLDELGSPLNGTPPNGA